MQPLPKHPVLFEISTWVWLNELSRRHGRRITLGNVPDEEWERLARMGVDLVWLMGVWERSPAAIALESANPIAISEFRAVLPDFTLDDLAGSPYSVHRFEVDARLGGRKGLAEERRKLARHGIRLILDFVPNHVAPDHPWTVTHPDYFIQGSGDDLANDPESFIQVSNSIFARGRDPNFPAWMDTVQLNAFNPGLRRAVIATLADIASQCDGVRVDMAMLFLNPVFSSTWNGRAGDYPDEEFWVEVIGAVKARFPGTIFMAEAYWDTERTLQAQGFDYCYDKLLYDYIRDEAFAHLAEHLRGDDDYQRRLVRFAENHDERRAPEVFPESKWKVMALAAATLPGLRMFYQGQEEGRRSRVSVLVGRWPEEPPDPEALEFYRCLFKLVSRPALKNGDWQLLRVRSERTAPLKRCAAWMWSLGEEQYVIVLNFGSHPAQIFIHVPISAGYNAITLSEIESQALLTSSLVHEQTQIFQLSLNAWNSRVYRVRS